MGAKKIYATRQIREPCWCGIPSADDELDNEFDTDSQSKDDNIFIKVNDQHSVFFYLLEFVPVTAIQKKCFGKIFAYKTHPNFGGNS